MRINSIYPITLNLPKIPQRFGNAAFVFFVKYKEKPVEIIKY